MSKVLVAMSGGVDSSVTACLLKEQGYDCIGVTMRLYDNEMAGLRRENTCCSLEDTEDARSVCYRIGIPFYVFNFTEKFEEKVIRRFVSAYEQGDTPNPCIDCNRFLKFDLLFRRAKELGCDYIATGHYARIVQDEESGRWLLKKGLDEGKDQSYVLYAMTQDQLAHTLLPLGGYSKDQVRQIAEDRGFLNAKKHDSQDICFVPDGDYTAFLRRYTGKDYPPGDFVDSSGKVLGTHKGTVNYTIGQRKGLGVAAGERLYVIKKNLEKNQVVLGGAGEGLTGSFTAEDLNLIAADRLDQPIRLPVAIRYHQKPRTATITQLSAGRARIDLDVPQRGIAPGQAVVFYDGDRVFGGATIQDILG